MRLWAGLGNPEPAMARQRHNIGFLAVDRIAARHGFTPWRQRFRGLVADGAIGGERILLLKPLTYMNASGESVQAASGFFKIEPDDVTAFHDELDLTPGTIRVKKGGGAAGHNGLRSIDQHLGTPDYWRVRLGIGHPGDKSLVLGYVLGNFSASEQIWLDPLLDAVSDGAALLAHKKYPEFLQAGGLPPRPKPLL